jgi:hypothetical protein
MNEIKYELPIGRALVAVESDDDLSCRGCELLQMRKDYACQFACTPGERQDGKNVVYRLATAEKKNS